MPEEVLSASRVITGSETVMDGAVVLRDQLLEWVGPAAALPDEYAGLARTDYPAATIMPGLIDSHVHLGFDGGRDPVARMRAESDEQQLVLMLRNARDLLGVGVTTARDLGGRGYLSLVVRDAIAAGLARGPRLVAAGPPVTVTGGHCWFMGGEADSEDDLRRIVRTEHKHGADLIKVMATGGFMTAGSAPWYAQFTAGQLAAVVEEARRVDMRVAAHAHGIEGIARVRGGPDRGGRRPADRHRGPGPAAPGHRPRPRLRAGRRPLRCQRARHAAGGPGLPGQSPAAGPARPAAPGLATAYIEASRMLVSLLRIPSMDRMVPSTRSRSGRVSTMISAMRGFSTHSGGRVAVYPMYSPSRQRERRSDILEMLKTEYRVQEIIDYSGLERDRIYLEGTGAMVVDHIDRVVYAARSNRTSPAALERFCAQFNYEPMLFDAMDPAGRPIYHTNVLMCIGTEFAMIGLSSITDPVRRAQVRRRIEETGRTVVDLSEAQVCEFAGNAIELTGGSVRCMIAGVHLAQREEVLA